MLYLVLFRREARDWVNGTLIGYDKTGAKITGFDPQWHHIYPRSLLKNRDIKDDDIHAIANITVLNERTNVNKLGGKAPWHYIEEFRIQSEALRRHLVPDEFAEATSQEIWDVKRYGEFLLQRAQLLAIEANRFLDELRGS